MRVIVAGGGIGGLATALSLHAEGIEVQVYDQVPVIRGIGAGINLQPNGVRELVELGLGDALARVGIETARLNYYNKLGQLIWSEPRGLAAGYAWPQYSIGRGDLHVLLLEAVERRIGAERVHAGHRCVAFCQDASGVEVNFADAATGVVFPPVRADALIGADGIRSVVRGLLHPEEGGTVHSGRIQWRGVVEAEPFLDGRTHVTMGTRDVRAIVYPMSEPARQRGRSLINWIAVLGSQLASGEQSWDRRASKSRFFDQFRDWNFDWIPFADLIQATEEVFEYPKDDRDPLSRWSFGRVTLLGDAAHPMRPVGSQAGSQAIVDARVLAWSLATTQEAEAGLALYEKQRLPAMNAVVLKNRELGPSVVMDIVEQRAPGGFSDIDSVIPLREREEIALSFKVAAGFDPATLNARPSFSVNRRPAAA